MRILMFVHSLRRGGAERVLLEVSRGLVNRGHDVQVACWLDVDEYADERYVPLVRHFLMRKEEYSWPWCVPRAAARLRALVDTFNPCVIALHTPTVSWVAAVADLGVPCVQVLHGYGTITRGSSIKDWLSRFGDRVARQRLGSTFTVVAQPMIDVASRHFAVPMSCFTCVPNGVDLQVFRVKPQARTKQPLILMVGTLSPNKGHRFGIRAIAEMIQVRPDVRLLIAGDGAHREELEALAGQLGISDNVDLLGRQEDVPQLMSSVHVLWQLSESEGLPMVALEAMATGLPIVGFDVRGTRDLLEDEVTGFLVPFGDVQLVVKRTLALLSDPAAYTRISERGRKRVEEQYSLERMVDGHERALIDVLTENGKT